MGQSEAKLLLNLIPLTMLCLIYKIEEAGGKCAVIAARFNPEILGCKFEYWLRFIITSYLTFHEIENHNVLQDGTIQYRIEKI